MGSLLALAVLCLLTVLSVTQCKYGPDKVTGLDRNKKSPASRCLQACDEQYKDALKAEKKLHKKNLKLCRHGDDDGDDDGDDGSDSDGDDGGGDDGDDDLGTSPGDGVNDDGGGGGNHGGDPACIALEEARHEAAVDLIEAGRLECIESCHHQGGGAGR